MQGLVGMKVFSLSLLISAALCAQTAPAPATPATPSPAPQAATQQKIPSLMGPSTPITPETVVAKIGEKSYTAAEMDQLLNDLPPQYQSMIAKQPQLLSNMFITRALAQQAEFQNLDKEPRWRQQLDFQRMNMLAQAEVAKHRESLQIKDADLKNWYEQNKDQYRVAKVKAIYISFSPPPPAPAAGAPATPPADTK